MKKSQPQKTVSRQRTARQNQINKARNPQVAGTVKASVAIAKQNYVNPPIYLPAANGSIRVKKKEFLTDVVGTSSFSISKYPINPASNATFPWLSTLASSFETYKLHSMTFYYQPTCATNNAGYSALMVDYDASDPSPQDKKELLMNETSVSTSVWAPITMKCDEKLLRALGPDRYTRTKDLGNDEDLKLYDAGNIFFASGNVFGGPTTIGELWVSYDVTLCGPQPPSVAAYNYSALVDGNVSVSKIQPYGTQPILKRTLLGVTVSNGDTIELTTAGRYLFAWNIAGTVLVIPTFNAINCTNTNVGQAVNVAGSSMILTQIVTYTGNGLAELVINCTGSGSVTDSALRICPYDTSFG
jgi:hypothetical protein